MDRQRPLIKCLVSQPEKFVPVTQFPDKRASRDLALNLKLPCRPRVVPRKAGFSVSGMAARRVEDSARRLVSTLTRESKRRLVLDDPEIAPNHADSVALQTLGLQPGPTQIDLESLRLVPLLLTARNSIVPDSAYHGLQWQRNSGTRF